MEFDLALISMPAFTQKSPSLYLASLATYLKEKQYNVISYDFGIQFYRKELKKFRVRHPLISHLKLSLYPLWAASNWLYFSDVINPNYGQFIVKSLCPVCSELYQPIFNEFKDQISLTHAFLDSCAEKLVSINTRAYGFSLLLGNVIASLYIIKKIKEKKPDASIIVGGPEVSPCYRALYYSRLDNIDFTIYHSEGEIPLQRVLSHLKDNIPKEAILGTFFKTKNGIYKTKPPELLDINKIPIPDFDLIDIGNKIDQIDTLTVITSKGCLYNCTFCNEPLIWGSYRSKSAKKIFQELYYYVENNGISQFALGDNSFTSSPSLQKALEHLSNVGIRIEWGGNCRINELNKQKLNGFHQHGLTHCDIGIESASPKVLQLMRKNIDISRAGDILKSCHQNQIKTSLYFLVGFPGETSEEFQKTIDFIDKNTSYIDDILTSVFSLMASTPIFHSPLLIPQQLGPKYINAFTYQTRDGVTHETRKNRFLKLHEYKNILN